MIARVDKELLSINMKGLGTKAKYGAEVVRWFGKQYKQRTMFMVGFKIVLV
jgi:hypothetical protein